MEVLVTDSFPTIERYIPVGFVGNIRGIKYSNSFDHIVVTIRNEDGLLFDIPIEGVQPIIDYVPRRGDAILFNYTNGDEIEGIILDFGYRKDDYALFVMIKEQPDCADYNFDCISSKRVLKVVHRYCLHEEETKVC
jgi:hypothetical protein